MSTKLPAAERRAQIMNAAIKLAYQAGYSHITRDAIAAAAGVSNGTVNKYYSTMPQLKRDVMRHAIRHAEAATGTERRALLNIIAQGITLKDRYALKAPESVRTVALSTLG